MSIVDYTEQFSKTYSCQNVVIAQGKDANFLALHKLEEPYKRADGKKGYYQLEYRWLSEACERETDQAYACVSGQDRIYLTKKEANSVLNDLNKNPEHFSLFNHFNLF